MTRVFVDTNVLIDLIADRKPFSKFAIALFNKAGDKKIRLFTSSHSITTTHYLLKKYIGEKELRNILYDLLEFVTVVAIDEDVIRKSLRSRHKDFEDAIQITCAGSIEKLDCIVTRNIKDLRDCELPVLTPDELAGRI